MAPALSALRASLPAMYAPTYGGFAQGGAGVNNAQSSGYNPNVPSAPPSAQQHMVQQPQHMMFNPQQFGPGAPHQSPYGGMGVNPGMMQNNNGMAQMPANNGLGMLHRILVIDMLSLLPLSYLHPITPISYSAEYLSGASTNLDVNAGVVGGDLGAQGLLLSSPALHRIFHAPA